MSTDLRRELSDLAQRTPSPPPPPDLWSRGVRRHRRRRAAGTVSLVAALALGGIVLADGLAGTPLDRSQQPVGTDSVAAVPDVVGTISPWAADTQGASPGPLAVVAGAGRLQLGDGGWWGDYQTAVAGVSATTGAYRFLDLPDLAQNQDFADSLAALSPDGRRVAYWTQSDKPDWVDGVAVYDTETGDVDENPIPTKLGLAPESLGWAGPDTLLVGASELTERRSDGYSADGLPVQVWRAGSEELEDLASSNIRDPSIPGAVSPQSDGFAAQVGGRVAFFDESGARRRSYRLTGPNVQATSIDPSGVRAVGLKASRTDNRQPVLLAGTVPDGAGAPLRLAPVDTGDLQVWRTVGWLDDQHVLVQGAVGPMTSETDAETRGLGIFSLDLGDGSQTRLVRETRQRWTGEPQYATALWSQAPAARPGPDEIRDPRLVVLGPTLGALVLLGLLVPLVLARRRRRALE